MFRNSAAVRIWVPVVAILVGALLFLPLVWLVRTAVTPVEDVFSTTFTWLPKTFTLDNFAFAFAQTDLVQFLANSLLVAGVSAVVATALASYAAYGLTVFQFGFKRSLMTLFLLAQVFPVALILVSLYPMLSQVHLLNSLIGLGVGYIILSLPSALYIMHGFMVNFPTELVEASRIDGAGEFRTFHSVVLPVMKPALIAVLLFSFMWGWNDLIFSVTLISSADLKTLGPGLLSTYLGQFRDNWAGIMAASIIASIPVVVLFIWLQKYFVRGMTAGAVKG
ncbi:carbohydrate ABC transporter permease [Diaminobutyricibacter sp. McL0618]|uniref:carbohydrate ABC transporter permease n=1 Tax=Leifsonia sp. McL0618 TaxID=3415677 RepID=UPI003CEF648E